jgi:uncharacterized membrane protein
MKSRAAIAGHPLHPIFVTIPIGLWCFAPVCDLIYHTGWIRFDVLSKTVPFDRSWKEAALYCLIGGLVGAVPAIITGLIDYPLTKNPGAAKIVRFHLAINTIAIALVGISVWLRWGEFSNVPMFNSHPADMDAYHGDRFTLLPVWISLGAVLLTGISGWLGGELVSRFGIGVHEDATRRGASVSDETR